ncbi:MAG: glutathione S-transferase family protein, partial [Gammaproteobacteria bacterium]|nr:glutathione S-transferase family protein [Gammaproteobacteria bacterium]
MLKVHFVAGTRAGRVVWLLEELGLEYEVNIMPFTKEGLKSPEHRSRHALGRVPVLEDGDISIFESGAIIDYVLERHKNGGLKPNSDAPEFPFYLQWYHYCEGMVMPPMNQIVVQTILLPADRRDEAVLNQAKKLLSKALAPVNDALAGKDYLIGDFSAADLMLGHSCFMANR